MPKGKEIRSSPFASIKDAYNIPPPPEEYHGKWINVKGKKYWVKYGVPLKIDVQRVWLKARLRRVMRQIEFYQRLDPSDRFLDALEAQGSSIEDIAEVIGKLTDHAKTIMSSGLMKPEDLESALKIGKLNLEVMKMILAFRKNQGPPEASKHTLPERKQMLIEDMTEYANNIGRSPQDSPEQS